MFDHRLNDDELLKLRERFERFYERTHPRPQRQTSWVVRAALVVLVIASVIVSCSHTIPAFLSTIEGDANALVKLTVALAAFAMVEVGMLTFAYISTRRKANAADLHINRQLGRGLALAFALAVVANLHSVLEPRFGNNSLWSVFSFVVFALVGLSAPTLAYIAGEVFGLTTLADEQASADADAAWWRGFEESWSEALERYRRGAVRAERPSVRAPVLSALPPQTDRQDDRQTDDADAARRHTAASGYDRNGEAVRRAVEHLRLHPEDMAMSLRPLADKIGDVGKDSVSKAKEIIRESRT